MQKEVWFYDLECLPNVHTAVFKNRETKERKIFVISEFKNDVEEYLKFLTLSRRKKSYFVGYNNLNYDGAIINYLLQEVIKQKYYFNNPEHLASIIRKYSDYVISEDFFILEWQMLIPQIDLFKILHYDNPSKSTSLKYLESVFQFKNIEEYEEGFNKRLNSKKQLDKLIHYNNFDVDSTEFLYYEIEQDIKLRAKLSKLHGLSLMNKSDISLGSEIFASKLAPILKLPVQELKKLRTYRGSVDIKDCILPIVNFKTVAFKGVLEFFNNLTVFEERTKNVAEKVFRLQDTEYTYGIGGMHACIRNGVYIPRPDELLLDIDVGSFYPALSSESNFHPLHLGKAFCKIYSQDYKYRLKIKKDPEKKSEAGGIKLMLNGVSGLGQSQTSYFYDLKFPLDIRINGQLLLSMLIEETILRFKNVKILQANTDGFTIILKKSHLNTFKNEVCKEWEAKTKLILEYQEYSKMCIRDVNNYIAVYKGDKKPSFEPSTWYDNKYSIHKSKGVYQVIPEANGKLAYHKNWDSRIIQKAVYDYFINGVKPIETIKKSTDIFDFLLTIKTNNAYVLNLKDLKGNKTKLNKITRVLVTSSNQSLVKERRKKLREGQKGSNESKVLKGFCVDIMNKIDESKSFSDYSINYQYYVIKANALIRDIEYSNLTLNFNNF